MGASHHVARRQGYTPPRIKDFSILDPSPDARRKTPARFRGDDRGQLLILTGVLLVLGFVVLGTTVVQLQALEESTSRLQRDSLMDSVDELVANFNRTVVDSVDIGDTNLTDFQERTRLGEASLRDTATRGGLYVSLDLHENPDKSLFWRDSRCGAYDRTYSDTGIIIGYDKDTKRETIAGAVYDLHITDGRQTIKMAYYVKVFDCMLRTSSSFIDAVNATTGTIENVTGSEQRAVDVPGDGPMWVNETLTGLVQRKDWLVVDSGSISSSGWNNAGNIVADGGGHSTHPVPFSNDFIEFKFLPPADMPNYGVATTFNISVHALHSPGLSNDDLLKLSATYDKPGQTETYDFTISPLAITETNFTFVLPRGPLGNTHWTHDELENTTWRLEVDVQGGADLLRTFHVEYVTAEVDWTEPEGYQVDAYFRFAKIPSPYDTHFLNLTYTVIPGTAPDEVFYLQVYDTASPTLWTTIKEMRASDGAPHQVSPPILLSDTQTNGNEPWFRIVDPTDDDNDAPADRDSIEIDWFELTSLVSDS